MSSLQGSSAAYPRYAAVDEIRVPQLSEHARPPDDILRFPPRKGFHPPADTAADRRAAEERAERQLRQLRGAGRSDDRIGVRTLRITALDARPDAGGKTCGATAESRRSRS